MASSIAFTRIGRHRNGDRLWLEGRKLERAGIEPGQRFDVTWEPEAGRLVVVFGAEGERVVSRRTRNNRERPVLSIASKELAEIFGPGMERVQVTIGRNRIVAEVHPHDRATRERFERLAERVRSGDPLRTGSLAHGGGILDHALHEGLASEGLDSRLSFAVELDPAILDVAATNNPIWDDETLLVEGGMEEVDPRSLPKVDILVAGLPCVGASRAGKAKNGIEAAEEHPTAGILFVPFLRIVQETNPSIVVLENVVEYGRELSATVIRTALRSWGYDVYETILAGNAFGALDDRRRLCLVAATKDVPLDLERLLPVRTKENTLGEIMETIDLESDAWKDVGYLIDKEKRDKAAGKNFSMNLVSADDPKVRTMGASYWKWRSAEPLVPHPDRPGVARLMTPAEHAAVKTIPYELVDGVSNTMKHTIMGNAVIHAAFRSVGALLGRQVVEAVEASWDADLVELVGEGAPALLAEAIEREGGEVDVVRLAPALLRGRLDLDEPEQPRPVPTFG